MRRSGRVLFSGAVTLIAVWALLQTAGWPLKAALYPRAVGIPLVVLAAAETILSLRQKEEDAGETVDLAFSLEVPDSVALRRTLTVISWFGAFLLAVILFGFPRAIPLFVFTFLKGQGREGWIISLLLAALAWLGFDLLFVRLLHLPFSDGLLWGLVFR